MHIHTIVPDRTPLQGCLFLRLRAHRPRTDLNSIYFLAMFSHFVLPIASPLQFLGRYLSRRLKLGRLNPCDCMRFTASAIVSLTFGLVFKAFGKNNLTCQLKP